MAQAPTNTTSRADRKITVSSDAKNQTQKDQQKIADILNEILSNEFAVFTMTLNYHWNITGPRFYSLHKFLEDEYRNLLEMMDELAERIRAINGRPLGTVKEMERLMTVKENFDRSLSADQMIEGLLADHSNICQQIQNHLNDESIDWESEDIGTQDLLVDLLKRHEKTCWMLNSHLQGERYA